MIETCECEVTNMQVQCERHQCPKSPREVQLCRQGGKYWRAWERCEMPMQDCFEGEKIQPLPSAITGGVSVEYKRDGKAIKRRETAVTRNIGKNTGLPGTKLKSMFAKIGIKDSPGCSCRKMAGKMDVKGPDWCEEHIEGIIDSLEAEAKHRPVVGVLFTRVVARVLIGRAIKQARKEQE